MTFKDGVSKLRTNKKRFFLAGEAGAEHFQIRFNNCCLFYDEYIDYKIIMRNDHVQVYSEK